MPYTLVGCTVYVSFLHKYFRMYLEICKVCVVVHLILNPVMLPTLEKLGKMGPGNTLKF